MRVCLGCKWQPLGMFSIGSEPGMGRFTCSRRTEASSFSPKNINCFNYLPHPQYPDVTTDTPKAQQEQARENYILRLKQREGGMGQMSRLGLPQTSPTLLPSFSLPVTEENPHLSLNLPLQSPRLPQDCGSLSPSRSCFQTVAFPLVMVPFAEHHEILIYLSPKYSL